jgi:hypothetical protein
MRGGGGSGIGELGEGESGRKVRRVRMFGLGRLGLRNDAHRGSGGTLQR